MKTKLLVSVAMAVLVAGTAGALAQQQEEKGGAPAGAKPGAAQHQMAPGGAGGAMQHGAAPGAQLQGKPEGGASEQHSVQGGPAEERGNTGMQRGAQENQPGKAGENAQEHAQTQPGGKTEENAQLRTAARPRRTLRAPRRSTALLSRMHKARRLAASRFSSLKPSARRSRTSSSKIVMSRASIT